MIGFFKLCIKFVLFLSDISVSDCLDLPFNIRLGLLFFSFGFYLVLLDFFLYGFLLFEVGALLLFQADAHAFGCPLKEYLALR